MDDPEELLARIRGEILPLFEAAIQDEGVFYHNPHLADCRGHLSCQRQECHVFSQDGGKRCWQEVGTYCGGAVQGGFVEKFGHCSVCPVFRASMPSIVEELGEHFNNLMYLIRAKSRALQDSMNQLADLNERLSTTFSGLNVTNAELEVKANLDGLTGLYNRHRLDAVIDGEQERSRKNSFPWSVAIMDIDNFKSLNDQYGHLEGDRVLAGLAEVIRKNIRGTDCAFRFGGEEFLLVLPRTRRASAAMVMDRIRKEFGQMIFQTEKGPVSRTLSAGVGEVSQVHLSREEILKEVDDCLYQAKNSGKNQVVSRVL